MYNKNQLVRIGIIKECSEKSDLVSVCIAVPQGTVLGLLCILLYINESLQIPESVSYANDTAIMCIVSTWEEGKNNINYMLKNMYWLSKNELSLNVATTLYIFSIECVYKIKYLGIFFDSTLKWKSTFLGH